MCLYGYSHGLLPADVFLQLMYSYSKAAAPRKTAATKVVAENCRSDEAALKVEVGEEAAPDSVTEPALVPAPAEEAVSVGPAEEPV